MKRDWYQPQQISNMCHHSYILNALKDILHSLRYHSGGATGPHHGEGLSRRSLPVSKYGSCTANTESKRRNHAAKRGIKHRFLHIPLYPSTVETTRGFAMPLYSWLVVSSAANTRSVNRERLVFAFPLLWNKTKINRWFFLYVWIQTKAEALGGISIINLVNWFLVSFPENLDRLRILGCTLFPEQRHTFHTHKHKQWDAFLTTGYYCSALTNLLLLSISKASIILKKIRIASCCSGQHICLTSTVCVWE